MKTTHLPKPPAAWLLLVSMLLPSTLHAQDTLYWRGGQDSLWRNANNWSFTSGGAGGAGIPDSLTTVVFDSGSLQNCYLDTVEYVSNVLLDSTDEVTLYIMSQAGSFTCSGNITIRNGTFYTSDSIINIGGNLTINGNSEISGDGLFYDSSKYVTVWDTFTVNGGMFQGLYSSFDDTDQVVWLKGPINLIAGLFAPPWNLFVYHDLIDTLGVFNVGRNTYLEDTITVNESLFNNIILGDSAFVTLMSSISMPGDLVLSPYSRLYIKTYGNPDIGLPWIVGFGGIFADSTAGIIYDDSLNLQPVVYAVVLNDTGSFDVPFVTMDNKKVPMDYTVEVPGSIGGTGLMFGGYATNSANNPNNLPYPTQIASLFESMNWNSLYAVDRYWLFGIMDASPPADGKLVLHYSTDDIGGANILDEARLVALHFDGSQFDVVKGVVDTVAHSFTLDSVSGSLNFYFLYDSAALPLLMPPNISPQVICSDTTQTFTFSNVVALVDGNQIEWATNSAFTGSTIVNSPATITVTVSAGAMDSIWIRSKDSVSGNVSSAVVTTATVNILPTASITPMDTFVLQGQWVTLTASGGTAYSWAGLDASGSTITVTPESDSTYYTVIGSNSYGCTDTVSALVRAMPFPILSYTNYTDTIYSGDSTNIAISFTDAGTAISWSRNNPYISGANGGTGNTIKIPLTNNSGAYQTVEFTTNGAINGYYADPVYPGVVVRPVSRPRLSVTYQSYPALSVTTCTDSAFRLVITSSDTNSFTIQMNFNYPLDTFYLLGAIPGFSSSFGGSTASIYYAGGSSITSDTISYSLKISCTDTSQGTSGTFKDTLTDTISVLNNTGSVVGSDTILYIPLLAPFINLQLPGGTYSDDEYDTFNNLSVDTIMVTYKNASNGDFNGSIILNRTHTMCGNDIIIKSLIVIGDSTIIIDTPHFPLPINDLQVGAGDTLTIIEIDSLSGSCVLTGCEVTYSLLWGCDAAHLCDTVPVNVFITPPSATPGLLVTRIVPIPNTNDVSEFNGVYHWDSVCTNKATQWEFLIQNTGTAPALNTIIQLTNDSSFGKFFTYILASSIQLGKYDSDSISALDTLFTLDTLTVGDTILRSPVLLFNSLTPGYSCYEQLVATDQPVMLSYRDSIPFIGVGQKLLLKFQTYRCCPSDAPFGMNITFDTWKVGAHYQMQCLLDTLGGNTYFSLDNYNSDPNERVSYYHLTQTATGNPTAIVGGQNGPGSPAAFQVQNFAFFDTTNDNAQIFCLNDADGIGLHPSGKLKINISCTPSTGLKVVDTASYPDIVQLPVPGHFHNLLVWVNDSLVFNSDSTGATAWFDFDSLPDSVTYSSNSLYRFLSGATLHFMLEGYCPDDSLNKTVTVSTWFFPNSNTCDTCWIPLSQASMPVYLLCPGCNTPGLVSTSYWSRANFGYSDTMNEAIPDGDTALVPIGTGAGYAPYEAGLLDTLSAMVGDTIRAVTSIYFYPGDSTYGAGGFTDGAFNDSFPSMPIKWLYIQQNILHGHLVGMQCVSDSITYLPAGGAVPQTIALTISPPDTVADTTNTTVFLFRASASSFGDTATIFQALDSFVFTALYVPTRNYPAAPVNLELDNYGFMSTDTLPPGDATPYENDTCACDTSILGLPAHNPDSGRIFLYYCEELATEQMEVYPLVEELFVNPGFGTCDQTYQFQLVYSIAPGYWHQFPYEYRLMPGIVPADSGLLSWKGLLPQLRIPVPQDFAMQVNSVETNISITTGEVYFGVAQDTSARQLFIPGDSILVLNSMHEYIDVGLFIDSNNIGYCPPFRSLGIAYGSGASSYGNPEHIVSPYGKPVLPLGDEGFTQTFWVTFITRCDSARFDYSVVTADTSHGVPDTLRSDTIGLDSIWASLPDIVNLDSSLPQINSYNYYYSSYNLSFPRDTFPFIVVPTDSFYGSYVIWNLRYYVLTNPAPENMILFIPQDSIDSLTAASVLGPNDTLLPPTLMDSFYRYIIPYISYNDSSTVFRIGFHLNGCGDSLNIPFYYSWSCQGLPDTLPPGRDACFAPHRGLLMDTVKNVLLSDSSSYTPHTVKACQADTLTACITNGLAGGAGNFMATLRLSRSVVFDTSNVQLSCVSCNTILTQVHNMEYDNSDSTWIINLVPYTALDSTNSIFGFRGLIINTGWMCLSLPLIPKCNINAIPAPVLTFYALTYCGATDTIPVSFDDIPVSGNACGQPMDSLAVHDTSCTLGSITAVVYGSDTNAPFSYYWNTGSTDSTAVPLVSDSTYSVTITDANGCYTEDSATLSFTDGIIAFLSLDSLTCSGTGNILAGDSLAVGNVMYVWSPGGDTSPGISHVSGTYTVTITDSIGCKATASATVPGILSAPTISGPLLNCDTGYVLYTVPSPDTNAVYHWTVKGGVSIDSVGDSILVQWSGAPDTLIVTGMVAGCDTLSYTVTVGNCCVPHDSTVYVLINDTLSHLKDSSGTGIIYNALPFSAISNGVSVNDITIFIVGTLTVDTNFEILNSPYVYMAAGASIVVENGDTLTLTTTDGTDTTTLLAGCDSMYKGIVVQPEASVIFKTARVRDADSAVYAHGGGTLFFKDVIFTQNFKSIVIDSLFNYDSTYDSIYVYDSVYPLHMDSVTFRSQGPLLAPYSANARSNVGIEINDVWNIHIGSDTLGAETYYGMDTAINLINSGAIVTNQFIKGDTIAGIGVGINARDNMGFLLANAQLGPAVQIGDTMTNSNTILSCDTGIRAIGFSNSQLEIGNNYVRGNDSAALNILIANDFILSTDAHVYIHGNKIYKGQWGIYLYRCQTYANIDSNLITFAGSNSTRRMGITFVDSLLTLIGDDTLYGNELDSVYHGITDTFRYHQHIIENTITLATYTGTTDTCTGISLYQSPFARLGCNIVTGYDASTEASGYGISCDSSTGTLMLNNTLSNLGVGIMNFGQQTLQLIENSFDTNATGIGISGIGAMIGNQGTDSTRLIGKDTTYDNKWTGTFAVAYIKSYAQAENIVQDTFFVQSDSPYNIPSTEIQKNSPAFPVIAYTIATPNGYEPPTGDCEPLPPLELRTFRTGNNPASPSQDTITSSPTPSLDYKLIPNLFKDNLTANITLGANETGEVDIYNLDGILMGKFMAGSGINEINLSNASLVAGMYLYKVFVNGQIKTNDKLVVVH